MAQLNRGTLTGVISYPSGAAVSGAIITAKHKDTGVASSTTTTDSGNCTLPALPIGEYQVEFEAPGFKKVVRNKTEVLAGVTIGPMCGSSWVGDGIGYGAGASLATANRIQPRRDQCQYEAGRGFTTAGEWCDPQCLQPCLDCARNQNSGRLPDRWWTGGWLVRNDAGDADEALRLCTRGLARFPRSPRLLAWRGFALREQGALPEARRSLDAALALSPNDLVSRGLLADVMRREGHHKDALRLFDQVLSQAPLDEEAVLGKSRTLAAMDDVRGALEVVHTAAAAAPQVARFRLELSQLYAKLGESDNASREAAEFRRPAWITG